MSYFKIPADDNDRLPRQLRQNVDLLTSRIAELQSISSTVQQIQLEGGSAAVEEQYGLDPGEGDDFVILVTSAATEAKDSSPLLNQYLSRCG